MIYLLCLNICKPEVDTYLHTYGRDFQKWKFLPLADTYIGTYVFLYFTTKLVIGVYMYNYICTVVRRTLNHVHT
jgi:hypothetical protein